MQFLPKGVGWLLLVLHAAEALQCPALNGVPCNGLGSCDASAKCMCQAGYGGVSCETKCATDALLRPCSGHGRCASAAAVGAACVCDKEYAGPACGEKCPQLNGVVCSGRGTCWSDSRHAYCRCDTGDGRMFAGYDGEACEISIYNPSTRVDRGNQTTGTEPSTGPLRALAVVPVLAAILCIWILLFSFRADWLSEYAAVLGDLYQDASSSWSNMHMKDIHLPHLRHLHQEKPVTPHALPAGASNSEVDAHTRAFFNVKLAPRIEKYHKELMAEEEALREQYQKQNRPLEVPKRVWKAEHMSKQNAIHSRAEVLNKQTIAEGLRLLDLSPDMPNASLSRLHRQSQAVRSQGGEAQFMRLMSGHGAFETADKPKKGAQDGERKLQRLSYDEFRLWVLEALRLAQHRQRKHKVEDWRQTAVRALKSRKHLPADLQRRVRTYAASGSLVQRTAEQKTAADILDSWAHAELYEEMARQGGTSVALHSPHTPQGREEAEGGSAARGKMSADEADEAEAQTIFLSCLTGSGLGREALSTVPSSRSRVPTGKLEARLVDMGLSSSDTLQILLEADHGCEGSVTYDRFRHAIFPVLRQRREEAASLWREDLISRSRPSTRGSSQPW